MSPNDDHPKIDAIILAAGKGTRMQSDLPKVMHEVADRPMVHWVVDACRAAGAGRIIVVVGHRAELVRDSLGGEPDVEFVTQSEQLGTGHAVDQAREALASSPDNDLLVLCGDGPLIRSETLGLLLDRHRSTGAAATLATAVIDDPTGYGRIVRDEQGDFARIVEQKDASEAELEIREVNPSYYCFRCGSLFDRLSRTTNENANGEYYVTDVFGLSRSDGDRVAVVDAVPPEDILSINTPDQLAEVDRILRGRLTDLEDKG